MKNKKNNPTLPTSEIIQMLVSSMIFKDNRSQKSRLNVLNVLTRAQSGVPTGITNNSDRNSTTLLVVERS